MSRFPKTVAVAAAALITIAFVPAAALAGSHVEYGTDASPRLLLTLWFRAVAHYFGFGA